MTAAAPSVETIRRGLACGRSGCSCSRERGNTHCPAPGHTHGDADPSLSVDPGERVPVVVRCHSAHANDQEAVIAALRELGLWPDAAPPGRARRNGSHPEGEGEHKKRKSQATRLVELAGEAGARLFHDAEGTAYASIPGSGGDWREVHPVRSAGFGRWLRLGYFLEAQATVSAQAVQDALGALEGLAIFPANAPEHAVSVRLAGGDGHVYLDLGGPRWQVAEVTADGWSMRTGYTCPVKFHRARGMLALPAPERGGSIDELRRYVNLASDDDFRLVVGWLLAALRDRGPYPVLALHGEQGSAKTTAARVLRALVDPNSTPVRAEPRNGRDLMIAAKNGWVVALDNLSHVPPWLSDALCRLATGGGFATRTLYSDDEETLFDAQRPVILNGIEELATRPDLLDRSIVVYLPSIPEDRRRPEAEFWAEFEASRPRILGALLDAVAGALRDLPTTRLARLPRMADFALWASAAEGAMGWERGSFLGAYTRNRDGANDLALDASAIAASVRELAAECGTDGWSGTATELLTALTTRLRLPEGRKPPQGWPGNGRALSNALRRIASNLRSAGVDVEHIRSAGTGSKRLIIIRMVRPPDGGDGAAAPKSESEKAPDFASHASPSSQQAQTGATQSLECDANAPSDQGLASQNQARSDACDACDAKIQSFSNDALPDSLEV